MTASRQPNIVDISAVNALLHTGRRDEALALLGNGNEIAVRIARGVVLRAMGRFEDAMEEFSGAVRQNPGDAEARTYLGMMQLMRGDLSSGWHNYRARWGVAFWKTPLVYPAQHLWDGKIDNERRVLFWAEQGYGDCIQFVRYLPWLQVLGVRLVFQCPIPLQRLIAHALPTIELLDTYRREHHFDAHLPLMDLPALLPNLPIESLRQPYMRVPPRMHPVGGGPRIGIVWAGRPDHPQDAERSIRPELLAPLFDLPGIEWVGMQQEATDIPTTLEGRMRVFRDFYETACCIDDLDMLVSVDTAVAHLAGAMGKPVSVLLPYVPDFRWGLETDTSPWYPSMKLFRQSTLGDWEKPVADLAQVLQRMFDIQAV